MNLHNCVMEDCNKELGPDALTFEHNGEPAGGICSICLDDAPAIRVVFSKNNEKVYTPIEITHIDKKL